MIITFDLRNSVTCGYGIHWSDIARLMSCYAASVVLVFGTTFASAGDGGNDAQRATAEVQRIVSWISAIGDISKTHATAGAVDPEACARLLAQMPEAPRRLAEELLFYRAAISWLAGDAKSFSENANAARRHGVATPELLLYEAMLSSTERDRRRELDDQYGLVVPLSVFGRRRDKMKSASELGADIDPPPPSVPLGNVSDRLSTIAALLAQHGASRRAIDVYLESIYAYPRVGGNDTGAMWVRVGELEKHVGRNELALRAFLRAVYYDPSKAKEILPQVVLLSGEAKKLQDKEEQERKDKDIDRKLSPRLASKIAELYRECNLHPFSLRVLSEVDNGSDTELDKQRQEIEKEWLLIVDKHQRVCGDKCMLLGVKVNDVKSWANVDILRPSDTYWKLH